MPILGTTSRNVVVNALVDQLDAGSTAGYIQYENSTDGEVATCKFGTTAFGAAAAGVATANTISDDTDAAGGTISQASWYDSGGTKYVECTVTSSGGGGEFEMSSVSISAGETVATDSLTVTMPSS